MTAYIIKSSLSMIFLFGLYWILLRKEKFFVFNRFFLIASVVFSLLVPFISVPVNLSSAPGLEGFIPANYLSAPEIIPDSSTISESVISAKNSGHGIQSVLLVLYLTGVVLLLVRFLRNLYSIINKGRTSEKISYRGCRLVLTSEPTGPCCFFDLIFLNGDDYRNGRIDQDLISHEMEHSRQFHSFDIILIELVRVFYWFNPVYLLYERAIRINHEYLADNVVIDGNPDIQDYAGKLLNFITCSSNISLTSGSNNSFTKMRLMMMMKSRSATTGIVARIALTLCAVTVFFLLLSFRESDNKYPEASPQQPQAGLQETLVKGIALGEDGKPVMLVTIIVGQPGETPTDIGVQTGPDGRFELRNIRRDATLLVSGIGYKNQVLKPDFNSEMVIRMVKDPDYKGTVRTADFTFYHEGEFVRIRMAEDKNLEALIVVDDKKPYFRGEVTLKRDEVASAKALRGKEATDKYGEQGISGVIEITTSHRAATTGMNTAPPASRLKQTRDPNDYPTFRGGDLLEFQEWIASVVNYPDEAKSRKIEGWVSVNYTINPDGNVSSTATTTSADPVLSDEVIRAITSSPKWDPPKNNETAKPYNSTVTLKFELPGRIIADPPFVVVEAMPMYPGGDGELLNFIKNNTKYPVEAAAEQTEGRVIVRFIVTTEGKTEGISVLKGIGPLFDAEAVRVVSLLKDWQPGMQNGKAVNTWYMVPVNFSLPQANK